MRLVNDTRVLTMALAMLVGGCDRGSEQARVELGDALRKGDRELVASIIEQRPKLIRARYEKERHPLHLAARWGDAKIVEILLASGADLNAVDEAGNTPLMYAAGKGHVEVTRRLLERRADTGLNAGT